MAAAARVNVKSSASFFLSLILIFSLLVTYSSAGAASKLNLDDLCEKPSQTWSGGCGKTQNCDKQCIAWEGALHGACHVRNGKHMCFCYFQNC